MKTLIFDLGMVLIHFRWRDFLTDIFGDEEPETLNEEYKSRIRDFVQGLLKEIDDAD